MVITLRLTGFLVKNLHCVCLKIIFSSVTPLRLTRKHELVSDRSQNVDAAVSVFAENRSELNI